MKIHIIPNSHIDPVWLWNKYEGIDEVLNTFRSACDRLDEYPTLTFSGSSILFYKWIKKYDALLFDRIKRYVLEKRWEISGGWLIEPDTNLPLEASFRKNAELSKRFMQENFNCNTKVASVPDTFGHPATLPKALSKTGFKYLIFCRPDPTEKTDLPSNLFYWEYEGHRVLAYRLKNHYTQRGYIDLVNDKEYKNVPVSGFFLGIGNHGGGPTIKEIEHYNKQIAAAPNSCIKYSTCEEFFKDAEENTKNIPVYKGDLHMHAVGCYSVLRNLKQKIRTSEHLLAKCERVSDDTEANSKLSKKWEKVLFNQFHDILPGSCSLQAEKDAVNQLGGVISECNDMLYDEFKIRSRKAPVKCKTGELRIFNSQPYDIRKPIQIDFANISYDRTEMFDANLCKITKQEILPDVRTVFTRKWEFIDTIPANGFKSYSFDVKQKTNYDDKQLNYFVKETKHNIDIADKISFLLLEDNSDTWSHGIQRYDNVKCVLPKKTSYISKGPISEKLYEKYTYNNSYLDIVYSKYYDLPGVYVDINLNWSEHRSILKMELNLDRENKCCIAQGAGGAIERKTDGKEMPLHNWLWCPQNKSGLAIIQDGSFAYDCTKDKLRINLVRSSLYGFHDPYVINKLAPQVDTDQGIHKFKLLILQDIEFDTKELNRQTDIFLEDFSLIHEGFSKK
jgi:alpha-mannosidase